ncbi:toxin VasX [Aquimarina algicola]|uniref:Toxin VasX N-terminal region domain-containing protein n=1 Tax=Aquimarina algicola TaxID=2589995 RepID=A0A504JCS9_9FLAO|nr:toxin VasX [Aquimarina algicola]TPN85423.1 hypothetical protein FHK87_15525 [Aquimarina algicola]
MATDTAPTQQETTGADTPADHTEGANMTTFCVNENEELCINFENKIRLYFLRYGLFAKHRKEEHLIVPQSAEDEEAEIIVLENAPTITTTDPDPEAEPDPDSNEIKHFYVAPTALNSGYLYLFDEDDKDLFYEYKIHIDGRAATVYEPVYEEEQRKETGELLDIREPSGEMEVNKHFKEGQKLWIGFSNVQWPAKYHEKMRTASADEKRQKGMVFIDCSGFERGGTSNQEHVKTYQEIRATFTEDQKASKDWMENTLEAVQKHDANLGESENPPIWKDMFVTLPDPIGCALDITKAICKEIIEHRAYIECARSGRDADVVARAMINGEAPDTYTSIEQDRVAMFSLAQMTYKLVYNDEEMIEMYDGGVPRTRRSQSDRQISRHGIRYRDDGIEGIDRQKLENVLGFTTRKTNRRLIRNLQNDLCVFIKHQYYEEAYIHHKGGTPYNILEGKLACMQPCRVLAINPRDIDRSMDLENNAELEIEDQQHLLHSQCVVDFLLKESDIPVYDVFKEDIEIDQSQSPSDSYWIDFTNKIAGYINSSIETYAERSVIQIMTQETVFTHLEARFTGVKIKTLTPGGQSTPVIDFRTSNFQEVLARSNAQLDTSRLTSHTYRARTNPSNFITRFRQQGSQIDILGTNSRGTLARIPIITTESREVTVQSPRAETASNIQGSSAFTGSLALLQAFNIANAFNGLSEPQNQDLFGYVSFAGTAADFTAASLAYTQSVSSSLAGSSSLSAATRYIGLAGSGVTVIMCGWSAHRRGQSRDSDAALAYAGAAAAFSIATIAGLTATTTTGAAIATAVFGSTALLGPIGWIAGAIAIGLYMLATWLTDSHLEAFFKNFSFSDNISFPLNGRTTCEYNRDFFASRTVLSNLNNTFSVFGDMDMRHINSFKDELAILTNMVVFYNIQLAASGNRNSRFQFDRESGFLSQRVSLHTEFTATLTVGNFLLAKEQLDYRVFYASGGMGRDVIYEIQPQQIGDIVIEPDPENNTRTNAAIRFRIPHDQLTSNPVGDHRILFVFRLDLGGGNYFPALYESDAGQEKYIYTSASILSDIYRMDRQGNLEDMPLPVLGRFGATEVKIATLSTIYNDKLWRN